MLGGGPKIGKTFVVLAILKACFEGSSLFGKDGQFVRKSRVLLVEREIGPYALADRIRDTFGEQLREVGTDFQVLSKPRDFSLSNPRCVSGLTKFCKDEAIDLLLFDPINKLWHGDENNSAEMLRLVDSLEELQDGKIGLVASHHFGKPVRGQGVDKWDSLDSSNFRGSTRLVDDADTLLMIQRIKGRLSPAWDSWRLKCRMMVRHSGTPEDFFLHFNEVNDRRMVWYAAPGSQEPAPKNPFPTADLPALPSL